jgi:hypothetical protein
LLTDAQSAVRSLTEATTESVVASSLSRLEGWRFALESLAYQLEKWEESAREHVLAEANDQRTEVTDE